MTTRPSARGLRPTQARRTVDLCPVCGVDMGGRTGGTRRIGLSSAERGLFLWECPECAGRWDQPPGRPPRLLPAAAADRRARLRPRPPLD